MHLPVVMTDDRPDADVVLTLKNYYRRKPQPLRDAEADGTRSTFCAATAAAAVKRG